MGRYCPQCGMPTVRNVDGGRERDVCPSCGWVDYGRTSVGVGALVLRGDCALLVERGIPPVGRWTIPSGWVEQEDTIHGAVVREVKEETNLDVKPLGLIFVRNTIRDDRNDVYLGFLCQVEPDAQPVPDGVEATQACFVHPGDFDQIDISPFTRGVVEGYLKHRPEPWPLVNLDVRPNAFVFGLYEDGHAD